MTATIPGACLAGVWPALAALALAFNVFVLRVHHPGHISGKLSDLAINFLLPLVLVAAVEWILAAGGRFRPLGGQVRLALCGVSALYFTLLQLVPPFVEVHSALLGLLDLPFGGARSFTRNVPDAADLLTLIATVFAARALCRVAEELPAGREVAGAARPSVAGAARPSVAGAGAGMQQVDACRRGLRPRGDCRSP